MAISEETKKKIESFAQDQSQYYLDRGSMTYWEKAQAKAEKTKRKAEAKAAKFKMRSSQAQAAQDDLMVYMSDYIEDLVSKGMSEEEAYRRAAVELAHDSGSNYADDIYEHYAESYFEQFNPFEMYGDRRVGVASGMYYGGCVIIGMVLGAVIGALIGFALFPSLFWVGAIVGFFCGILLGVGVALILHGRAISKMEK